MKLRALTLALLPLLLTTSSPASIVSLKKPPKKTPTELRDDYLDRLMVNAPSAASRRTTGSLWSPEAILADPSADYKARQLHDTVIVQVSVLTNAAQTGAR